MKVIVSSLLLATALWKSAVATDEFTSAFRPKQHSSLRKVSSSISEDKNSSISKKARQLFPTNHRMLNTEPAVGVGIDGCRACPRPLIYCTETEKIGRGQDAETVCAAESSTDQCPDDIGYSYTVNSLPLSLSPEIDGEKDVNENGDVYAGFNEFDMWTGGKNIDPSDTSPVGKAHIAHFCAADLLCVATYSVNGETIAGSDNEWVWIGKENSKLTENNSELFQYLTDENGDKIGYEGCWSRTAASLDGQTVQVHYNFGEQTRSTGKDVGGNGILVCMGASCDTSVCDDEDNDCDHLDTDCKDFSCDSETKKCTSIGNPDTEKCDGGCCNNGVCDPSVTLCLDTECGNGVVNDGEFCDDGNNIEYDGCYECQISPKCGDGKTDELADYSEDCDNGDSNSDDTPDACRTDCTNPTCGDGVKDSGEECDRGLFNSDDTPDACRTDCTNPTCGDGVVDSNEDCDDGPNNTDDPNAPSDACRTDCTRPRCGDGIVTSSEECDEGENNSNDANALCRTNCLLKRCGDGIVDDGEECDLGVDNGAVGSSCSDCQKTSVGPCDGDEQSKGSDCSVDGGTDNGCCSDNSGQCVEKNEVNLNGICCSCGSVIFNVPTIPDEVECDGNVFPTPEVTATVQCGGQTVSIDLSTSTDITTTQFDEEGNEIGTDSFSCGARTTFTWTATPPCGQPKSLTKVVSYEDTTAPVAPQDENIQVACKSMIPVVEPRTATDACVGDITVRNPSTTRGEGCDIIRTYVFEDKCGKFSTMEINVDVSDEEGPTFDNTDELADTTVQCIAEADAITTTATVSDACEGLVALGDPKVVTTPDDSSNTCEDATRTRKWTATDECGNQSTYTQTISIEDTTPPTFPEGPANEDVQCSTEVSTAQSPNELVGNDNCDGAITPKYDSNTTPGTCKNDYVETRKWTYTDKCGKTSVLEQTVTVKDNTAPELSTETPVPSNIDPNPETGANQCAFELEDYQLTAVDNCGFTATKSPDDDTTPFGPEGCPNKYTTVRKWNFIDECGNSLTPQQNITVDDTTQPTFDEASKPGDQTFTCYDKCVTDNFLLPSCTGGSPTATDNCDEVTATPDDSPFDNGLFSVVTRKWTATDLCGNSASFDQFITINDACSFSVSEAFSGVPVKVDINAINVDRGVQISVAVNDPDRVADIRGVFFKVLSAVDESVNTITDLDEPGKITSFRVDEGNVDKVANDVLMKGGGKNGHVYDIGVQIGTQGIGKDDYDSTNFFVAGITTEDLNGQEFGVRLTSVSDANGGREESSKVFNNAECCSYVYTPPPEPVCGNGKIESGEECDDNNTDNGDGCSSTCQNERPTGPVCGNGIKEGDEECDDGNIDNEDGCSATCKVETCPDQCTVDVCTPARLRF